MHNTIQYNKSQSYMSPKMPANVFRRFFIVSSDVSSVSSRAIASTVPGDAGPGGRGAGWPGWVFGKLLTRKKVPIKARCFYFWKMLCNFSVISCPHSPPHCKDAAWITIRGIALLSSLTSVYATLVALLMPPSQAISVSAVTLTNKTLELQRRCHN